MKFLLIYLLTLCAAVSHFGQTNVGTNDISSIIPGGSTCHDVEGITRKAACGRSMIEIDDGKERVSIYFQNKECEWLFGNVWRLRIGTVIAIIKDYSTGFPLNRLSYSLDTMTKSNDDINTYFTSSDGTISITIQGGLVMSIWLLADSSDNCEPCRSQGSHLTKVSQESDQSGVESVAESLSRERHGDERYRIQQQAAGDGFRGEEGFDVDHQ